MQPLQERNIDADVEVTQVRGNAGLSKKLHISVNKVKLYEQLQEHHIPITVQDVQNTSIDKLLLQLENYLEMGDGESNAGGSSQDAPSLEDTESGERDTVDPNPDGNETAEPDAAEPDATDPEPEGSDTAGFEIAEADGLEPDVPGEGEASATRWNSRSFTATGGIVLVYLLSFVLGLFGVTVPYLHDNSLIGIGITIIIIIVAALISFLISILIKTVRSKALRNT